MATIAEAKTKRLVSSFTEKADALAKDREASFAGDKAMPVADFQSQWTEFVYVFTCSRESAS